MRVSGLPPSAKTNTSQVHLDQETVDEDPPPWVVPLLIPIYFLFIYSFLSVLPKTFFV